MTLNTKPHTIAYDFGKRVDIVSLPELTTLVARSLDSNDVSVVFYIINTHQTVLTAIDKEFDYYSGYADYRVSDSSVLLSSLKALGYPVEKAHIYRGFDIFRNLLSSAESFGWNTGLIGGQENEEKQTESLLKSSYPQLKLTYNYAPPFKPISDAGLDGIIAELESRDCQLVFVALGCPKQEILMSRLKSRGARSVFIGIGAGLDFFTGKVEPSPDWVHHFRLEWFYRLLKEPKRLAKRYVVYNTMFLFLFAKVWLKRVTRHLV